MSHAHHHSHPSGSEHHIASALFLNLFFVVVEVIGGLLTNSYAILSDALHDLGDTLSLAMAWYLERVAKREQSSAFSAGYRRFSLLGALINNLILLGGSIFILSEVVPRIMHPQHNDGRGMFLLAIFGILVNGLAAWRTRKGSTMNEKAVSLHLLEDLYGWIVVLVAGLLIMIKDIHVIDPLLSLGITLYILYNVAGSLIDTAKLFLQGTPANMKLGEITQSLILIEGVNNVYELQVWSLDGAHNVLSAHLEIADSVQGEALFDLKSTAKHQLESYSFTHITLELERSDERTDQNRTQEHAKLARIIREESQLIRRRSFIPTSRLGRLVMISVFAGLFLTAFWLTPESIHDADDPYVQDHPELLGETLHGHDD